MLDLPPTKLLRTKSYILSVPITLSSYCTVWYEKHSLNNDVQNLLVHSWIKADLIAVITHSAQNNHRLWYLLVWTGHGESVFCIPCTSRPPWKSGPHVEYPCHSLLSWDGFPGQRCPHCLLTDPAPLSFSHEAFLRNALRALQFATKVQLDSRKNWLNLGGQRWEVSVTETSQSQFFGQNPRLHAIVIT